MIEMMRGCVIFAAVVFLVMACVYLYALWQDAKRLVRFAYRHSFRSGGGIKDFIIALRYGY